MMTSKPEEPWAAATFEGARRAQIRRMMAATPRQRLETMIELEEVAYRLARTERRDGLHGDKSKSRSADAGNIFTQRGNR